LFAVDAIYLVALSLGRILANEGATQLTNGLLFRIEMGMAENFGAIFVVKCIIFEF
jgi:hypothetical protein